MKNRQKILPTVCCIALLSACASNQSVSVAPMVITPVTITKNGNDKPETMYQMGRYYQGQNRYDLAIAAYQKALTADDSFVEARNGLGVIYSRQGKYREAIEAFQAAIQQAPKAAHLYSNLGYAYYLQGRYGESVAALEQATTLDPANQRAFDNLGLAYAKAGNKSESNQAFAQAAKASAVASTEALSQNASPLPVEVASVDAGTNMAPVTELPASQAVVQETVVQKTEVHKAEVQKPVASQMLEVQTLALPKDRGIIRSASGTLSIPVVESRVKLVQVAPNVYEIQEQQYNVKPIQIAAVADASSVTKVRVEVANGNGVTGMAGKVGQLLRNQGYPAARLTNQRPFQVQMTQIQYRDGHQAEAQLLKSSLMEVPEMIQRNDLRADVGVRLVLGKDMQRLAHFEGKWQKLQLALTSTLSSPES